MTDENASVNMCIDSVYKIKIRRHKCWLFVCCRRFDDDLLYDEYVWCIMDLKVFIYTI